MSNSKVNILLVDDQPAKLLSYQTILAELGENLYTARSGRDALKMLMNTDYAVLLVDVCMPDMDGFELASLIREHPRFKKTAIILVSAVHLSEFDRLHGYDSGAVDYVPVPIVPEMLRAKVRVFSELYRKSEELRQLNAELEQRVAERTSALETSTSRLRKSEERLHIALNTGRLGAWELDLSDGTMRTTAICNANLGLPPEEKLDREGFLATVYQTEREAFRQAMQRSIEQGTDFELEHQCIWPDCSTHWIIVRGRPVCDESGKAILLLGVNLDITERRRVEEERVILLESERAARLEAERAARAKDEFLAMLSHELRSPLNAILGWAQLLKRDSNDPQALNEGLEIIERNARAQARLIDDLLDVSRVVSGKVRLDCRSVNLVEILNAAIETVRPLAETRKIEIVRTFAPMVPSVHGDAGRLQQVIANLLSNAVKFSHHGGLVNIAIKCVQSEVELSVSDHGIGIEAEFLPYIFDRFRQADSSTTRQHGGLGLGLSIAKQLVELQGGTIRASSDGRNCGATFVLRLPVEPLDAVERELAASGNMAEQSSLSGVRVLVVDDDPDSCAVMARLLGDRGALIETANSASEALEKLATSEFKLLVSDVGMPEKDGCQMIREVRGLSVSAANIPAIAVTAFARDEDRLRALNAGFNRYVSKPVDADKLFTAIAALLHSPQTMLDPMVEI